MRTAKIYSLSNLQVYNTIYYLYSPSSHILTWKKHRKLKCPHNPFCCCRLFKLWVLLAEEKSGLPFGGGDSMKHPPWLFLWDFLLCFPFFQDVLRESRYLATGFCYNKYRKLKKWAIHSFLVISHVGRNIILRTSDSATLLSLKHYFQRNECPGPDCISDFLFGFGWETEPRGLFVLTGHIRNSQTVYNSPHGHTESTGSVGTFGNKSQRLWLGPLTQLSSPHLGFGPWAQAWLSLSQGIGTMKLRLVLDSLNLCLRFFFF